MASDADIKAGIEVAFGAIPRPEHFTDYNHCDECFEHDELLQQRDRETLDFGDLGNGAWDPITMTTAEGFLYFVPALVRLSLTAPDPYWGWYGEYFIFHLAGDGPFNRRWEACSPVQRRAIHAFLVHVLESRAELVDESLCSERLMQAIDVWSVSEDVRQ